MCSFGTKNGLAEGSEVVLYPRRSVSFHASKRISAQPQYGSSYIYKNPNCRLQLNLRPSRWQWRPWGKVSCFFPWLPLPWMLKVLRALRHFQKRAMQRMWHTSSSRACSRELEEVLVLISTRAFVWQMNAMIVSLSLTAKRFPLIAKIAFLSATWNARIRHGQVLQPQPAKSPMTTSTISKTPMTTSFVTGTRYATLIGWWTTWVQCAAAATRFATLRRSLLWTTALTRITPTRNAAMMSAAMGNNPVSNPNSTEWVTSPVVAKTRASKPNLNCQVTPGVLLSQLLSQRSHRGTLARVVTQLSVSMPLMVQTIAPHALVRIAMLMSVLVQNGTSMPTRPTSSSIAHPTNKPCATVVTGQWDFMETTLVFTSFARPMVTPAKHVLPSESLD